MAKPYPQYTEFALLDAEDSSETLNQQIWRHAQIAEARGLAFVVEIWARSSALSRALDRFFRKDGELVRDTLQGVYLLRVDLAVFGPERVLKLTPFALAGVPLFLGWNPVGQVLTAREFGEPTPEDLAQSLSAFVEDVLSGRPHTLNPRPKTGSQKWDAKLSQLREERGQWRGPAKLAPKAPVISPAPLPPPPAISTEVLATGEAPVASATPPAVVAAAAEPSGTIPLASESPLPGARLERELNVYLSNARRRLADFALKEQLDLDFSLESLQLVDRYLDRSGEHTLAERAADLVPVLGVYLGDTVQHHRDASWFVDSGEPRLVDALKLRVTRPDGEQVAAPVALVLELAIDRSRSLFGYAVHLCAAW